MSPTNPPYVAKDDELMSVENNPDWPAWVVASLAVGGAIFAFFKRFFSTVTRDELNASVNDMRHTMLSLHEENQEISKDVLKRLSGLEQNVSNMEGRMMPSNIYRPR